MDTVCWLLNSHLLVIKYILLLTYITSGYLFHFVDSQPGPSALKLIDDRSFAEDFHMSWQLPILDQVLEDSNLKITFNCSFKNGRDEDITLNKTLAPLFAIIKATETRVVVPKPSGDNNVNTTKSEDNSTLKFTVDCSKRSHNFWIHTNTVGRSLLRMQISNPSKLLYNADMDVPVTRQVRMPDLAFDCATPVIMLLVTFSVGCVTDLQQMRTLRSQPIPILIGLISQLFVMPLVSPITYKSCVRLYVTRNL